MGTADRIERERHEKRARILEAARELFVERGVEAVTLREIAARIEYSTTAIYVHFKDKAALVQAMLDEDFAAFAAGQEAAATIADPVERLRALHDAYVEFALRMPHHYQLLFMTPAKRSAQPDHGGATDPTGIDGYRVLRATVAECLAQGRLRDELDDADAVAQVTWANVHGLVSLLITMGGHPQFRWRARTTLAAMSREVLLAGLLKPPAASRTRRRG